MTLVIDSVRCEVLNASYEPLSVVSARRAFNLCMRGKATLLEAHPTLVVESANDVHAIPTQILMNRMIKSNRTTKAPAQLTQKNLFVRDKYTCQYCGRHKSELAPRQFLTRDHVFPKSKGGKDTWTNLVTTCNTCNNKKADTLLEDTNLTLRRIPHVPTVFEIWSKANSKFGQRS